MPYTLTTSVSTAVLQLNRSGGTLQPGASHTIIATLDRAAAPEGDLSANIRVNAGAAGQPVIGVTARIAPRPPVIETISLDPNGWFFPSTCPTTDVRVTFDVESGLRSATLFWEIQPGGATGSRAMTGTSTLVADLPRPTSPSESIDFWVVLVDDLGAVTSTEADPRSLTASTSTC
jgi:hypothetical protein